MSDLETVMQQALEAIRLLPVDDSWSPATERKRVLAPVLERLPRSIRQATRGALETRIGNSRLLRAVNAWAWPGTSLVLAGRTGVGKTSAAGHLVRRLCGIAAHEGVELDRAQLIRWQECRALSRVFREAKLGTGTPEEIVRCQNARLLVLDDLGVNDDRDALEMILQVRNERAWPTVTTTGIGSGELHGFLGDALNRRLLECGAHKGTIVDTEENV